MRNLGKLVMALGCNLYRSWVVYITLNWFNFGYDVTFVHSFVAINLIYLLGSGNSKSKVEFGEALLSNLLLTTYYWLIMWVTYLIVT